MAIRAAPRETRRLFFSRVVKSTVWYGRSKTCRKGSNDQSLGKRRNSVGRPRREPSKARRAIPQIGRMTKNPTTIKASCVPSCRSAEILRIGHSLAGPRPAVEDAHKDHQDDDRDDVDDCRDGELSTGNPAVSTIWVEDVIG